MNCVFFVESFCRVFLSSLFIESFCRIFLSSVFYRVLSGRKWLEPKLAGFRPEFWESKVCFNLVWGILWRNLVEELMKMIAWGWEFEKNNFDCDDDGLVVVVVVVILLLSSCFWGGCLFIMCLRVCISYRVCCKFLEAFIIGSLITEKCASFLENRCSSPTWLLCIAMFWTRRW